MEMVKVPFSSKGIMLLEQTHLQLVLNLSQEQGQFLSLSQKVLLAKMKKLRHSLLNLCVD
jgi:hypothetical protein